MRTQTSNLCASIRRNEQGNLLVLLVIFMVGLFGFAALSLDVGNVYVNRTWMQEGADAASLAAVRDWAAKKSTNEVINTARAFGQANGLRNQEIVSVSCGTWNHTNKTFTVTDTVPPGSVAAVRVRVQRNVGMFFAQVIGFRAMRPGVESIAATFVAPLAARVVPWAVCDQAGILNIKQCTPITLKYTSLESGTNSCQGVANSPNFGALALGGTGAGTYQNNIVHGFDQVLRVGDCVFTETGNMSGPTFAGMQERLVGAPPYFCTESPPSALPENKRLAIVPRVNDLLVDGRGKVCITGFYVVALQSMDDKKETVNARFLEAFNGNEVDPNLAGSPGLLSGLALVR